MPLRAVIYLNEEKEMLAINVNVSVFLDIFKLIVYMLTKIVILEYPARTTVPVHILSLSIKFLHLGLSKCIIFTDYIMY
jgi:hypothetical protein